MENVIKIFLCIAKLLHIGQDNFDDQKRIDWFFFSPRNDISSFKLNPIDIKENKLWHPNILPARQVYILSVIFGKFE